MVKTDDFYDMEKPPKFTKEEMRLFAAVYIVALLTDDVMNLQFRKSKKVRGKDKKPRKYNLKTLSNLVQFRKKCKVCGVPITSGTYCTDWCWKREGRG